MTTNEWDLTVEWLESLKIVREAGMAEAVPALARQVHIEWAEKEILPCAVFTYRPNEVVWKRSVKVQVTPALCYVTNYRVERLEVLTYVAAECLAHLLHLDAFQLKNLCITLGCANTHILTPRERWRRLGIELDPRQKDRQTSLVALMYEDRPLCSWCKVPMATLSNSLIRKDLHEGCYEYLKMVRGQLITEHKPSMVKKGL